MSRRGTPFQRWQFAGCPTIPSSFNPWSGYFQSKIDAANAKHKAQEALDAYSKSVAANAQKGFLARAASAVGRFFQRRRA